MLGMYKALGAEIPRGMRRCLGWVRSKLIGRVEMKMNAEE